MSNKVKMIEALIQELDLEEATEVLDVLLMQVITLRAEEEKKTSKLKPVGEPAPEAEVVAIEDYRKPSEPISLDDYRNRSKD